MPIRIALYKICMLMNRELKSSVHYVLTAQKSSPSSLQGYLSVSNLPKTKQEIVTKEDKLVSNENMTNQNGNASIVSFSLLSEESALLTAEFIT
ncbi:hypothetical protein T12_504 [Trichinella patagoniensis]|uniref:Uncharacterized protein n=1 Tax=Trichinella patagoniensis TaxID=990121 RepID=A0A0V0ZJL3_9BILA|nr:hypothetical protein T12_504 [Trichinella patagoniensis]